MNRMSRIPFEVEMYAQLADLKQVDYQNTLVITALVELLVEKGLLTRKDVLDKVKQLEEEFHPTSNLSSKLPEGSWLTK
jgi:hypothetical protein